MSLGAVRVKEEPACAATDHVTIKAEPDLNEAEWVNNEAEWVNNEAEFMPQLCVQQEVGFQLEPACTKQEPMCVPPEVCVQLEPACTKQEPCVPLCELEPVYTELETVCFNEEPMCVQQPVCVKEETFWQESVSSELDQEYKYEIPLKPSPPPTGTPDVKRINWDCFVRLERCVVPRAAALRWERAAASRAGAAAGRPGARRAAPSPRVSRAHEREIAIRQLSGSLIKRIDKTGNSYSCEICKKQYKSLACLTTHKLGHTKTRTKAIRSHKSTYFCEICKAVFHDLDSLKVHALVHAKVRIPLYFCDVCHREFATNYALRTHKRDHEYAQPFKCHICTQRFSRKQYLSRHLAAHRSQKHRGKLTAFCKGCETKHAMKQLGDLLRLKLGQTSENTDYCELCNNYV